MKKFVTENARETRELGALLARELRGGELLCLEGDLGAGKTTFTQGLLKSLGAKGPYTSPTFVLMKEYRLENKGSRIKKAYHIDAYRVGPEDIFDLGWKEIISDDKNVTIVEWSDRIRKILPSKKIKINFRWLDEKKREIAFS